MLQRAKAKPGVDIELHVRMGKALGLFPLNVLYV